QADGLALPVLEGQFGRITLNEREVKALSLQPGREIDLLLQALGELDAQLVALGVQTVARPRLLAPAIDGRGGHRCSVLWSWWGASLIPASVRATFSRVISSPGAVSRVSAW